MSYVDIYFFQNHLFFDHVADFERMQFSIMTAEAPPGEYSFTHVDVIQRFMWQEEGTFCFGSSLSTCGLNGG